MSDPAIGDPVTHAELELELQRLRAAITLISLVAGLPPASAGRLMDLLTPPYERHEIPPGGRIVP